MTAGEADRVGADFWSYSCARYADPGVAAACLLLQDRCGADVNILLYALFAAHRGRRLSADDFAVLDTGCREWREQVVHPLRAARRALKRLSLGGDDGASALRGSVKRAELEAERLQQDRLAGSGGALGTAAAGPLSRTARDNVAAYVAACGLAPLAENVVATLARAA